MAYTKQQILDTFKDTQGPDFSLVSSANGNFRLQMEPQELKKYNTEERWQAFLDAANGLRKAGIECSIKDSFKGRDGNWVTYPTLWVNQPEQAGRSTVDIAKAIEAGIKAGLAAAKTAEVETKPTETPSEF